MPTLREQLDARQPLCRLAESLPWATFEGAFVDCYSEEGRPAKPVRLMVGLLLLKQPHSLGDETVVAQWVQNPYWQFFCGCEDFQWELPCDPGDLVYFRQRIGATGVAVIFAASAQLHGRKSAEAEVVIDSTVQEKAVTCPSDTKLCRRMIARCWKLADRHGVRLRRRYRKLVRQSLLAQRWRQHPRRRKEARRGVRRLRTIAGRLVRELTRKLPAEVGGAQAEVVQGGRPGKAIVDRGHRGAREVGGTQILVPGKAPAGQGTRRPRHPPAKARASGKRCERASGGVAPLNRRSAISKATSAWRATTCAASRARAST